MSKKGYPQILNVKNGRYILQEMKYNPFKTPQKIVTAFAITRRKNNCAWAMSKVIRNVGNHDRTSNQKTIY